MALVGKFLLLFFVLVFFLSFFFFFFFIESLLVLSQLSKDGTKRLSCRALTYYRQIHLNTRFTPKTESPHSISRR